MRRLNEQLAHVDAVELVPELAVVVARADARNDGELPAVVLLARDPLGLLHQQLAETLVLELLGVPAVDANRRAVDVLAGGAKGSSEAVAKIEPKRRTHQFADDARAHAIGPVDQLLAEGALL